MSQLKIDKSLAEVLEWRENLQKTTHSMSEKEEIEYLHQQAQEFVQQYGFKRWK